MAEQGRTEQANAPGLTLTEEAAAKIRSLVEESEAPALGLRVGVRGGGCNGIGCSEVGLSEIRNPVSPLSDAGLDVTVEQEFAVGHYEIVVLSSTDAADLMTWLNNQGYGVSDTAQDVLATYIEGGSQFFAAKVGLDDPVVGGGTFLEPLQVRYKSDVLSLPIRLGTLNSPGVQDLILYVLGVQTGRVGIANYPEVQVEGDCMVDAAPGDFATFYADQLDLAFADQEASWMTEYAWAPAGCDPCPPGGAMNPEDLLALGVPQADVNDTTLTRLHMRYTAEAAAEDLVLYETGDWAFDQMRYIQYKEELEGTFPVCGSGWADKPKLCPHQKDAVQQSTVGGWLSFGFVGVLAGLGLLFRRRRLCTPLHSVSRSPSSRSPSNLVFGPGTTEEAPCDS